MGYNKRLKSIRPRISWLEGRTNFSHNRYSQWSFNATALLRISIISAGNLHSDSFFGLIRNQNFERDFGYSPWQIILEKKLVTDSFFEKWLPRFTSKSILILIRNHTFKPNLETWWLNEKKEKFWRIKPRTALFRVV